MKNPNKIAAAEQVVAHAKTIGFENAHLIYTDEEGHPFDSLEEIAENYGADEEITASIYVALDEELAFTLLADPENEDEELHIQFRR